jgi:predicted CXXCH cytochrome family protein
MRNARELIGPGLIAVLLLAGRLGLAAQRVPANPVPPSVVTHRLVTGNTADYVGAERCQSCHKAEFTEFQKTPHAALADRKGVVSGCEICHGPGRAHSEGEENAHGDDAKTAAAARLIFNFSGTAKENASRCLMCHATGKNQANFAHSEHFMHGVSCDACHSAHLVEGAREAAGIKVADAPPAASRIFLVPARGVESAWLRDGQLRAPQPELCDRCHADVEAKFALPVHHRVPEGLMTCTDCHQPHGTQNPARLREIRFDACVKCHAEKRGPFVFEHAAVQVEGCIACHTPHGSVNHMLLARRETRFLCLQCHVDPFAANTPHSRLGFQTLGDCTRCHVAIHGSDFSDLFLQ